MKMGETTTPIDWGKILTGATTLVAAYIGSRPGRQPAATPPPAPAPAGMSSTTKTLLIGGGILAAGLLIYSMTKKK